MTKAKAKSQEIEELIKKHEHVLEKRERMEEFHRQSWLNDQKSKQFMNMPNEMRAMVRDGIARIIVDESKYVPPDDKELGTIKEFLEARITDLKRVLEEHRAAGSPGEDLNNLLSEVGEQLASGQ